MARVSIAIILRLDLAASLFSLATLMTPIADIWQPPSDAKTFRLRRSVLFIGIVCAVVFLFFDVGSTTVAYWNIDGSFARPKPAALLFGVFWSAMLLLAIFMIVGYFRERLFLAPTSIMQQGTIGSRTMAVGEVTAVIWRCRPVGGSIVVRDQSRKIKIQLGVFAPHDADEIIRFFRDTFPEAIQQNWVSFESFKHEFSRPPSPSRRRIILASCIYPFFVWCCAVLWLGGLGVQFLFCGIIAGLSWLFHLWRLNKLTLHSTTKEMASKEEPGG